MKNDERIWVAWATLLRRMHAVLRYSVCPIQEVLKTVERRDLKALAWLDTYDGGNELCAPVNVSESEKDFVRSLFAGLGTTDLEGQLRHLEQHTEEALARADVAKDVYEHRAKAYTTTGICAGLCIGLLLI